MNARIILNRFGLLVVKHGPEILTVVGTTGTFASGFFLGRAKTEADRIIGETVEKVDLIKKNLPNMNTKTLQKEMKRQIGIEYRDMISKLIKLYGPAIALGIFSVGCLAKSNDILNSRNASLIAAYNVIDSAFKRYRQAVVEKYGEDEDRNLRLGVIKEKVATPILDAEGNVIGTKEEEASIVPESSVKVEDYGRWFDKTNPLFLRNTNRNIQQLITIQAHCNDLLQANGHLFLNDVYKELGFEDKDYGQIVGWLYYSDKGDGVVDFRIRDPIERSREEFEDPALRYEPPGIWLDFNVEGPILDRI